MQTSRCTKLHYSPIKIQLGNRCVALATRRCCRSTKSHQFTTIISTEGEEVREGDVQCIYKITAETNARNERGMLIIAVENDSNMVNLANCSHDLLFRKKPRPLPQAYSQNSPKIKSRK